jgi:hypothetical protein
MSSPNSPRSIDSEIAFSHSFMALSFIYASIKQRAIQSPFGPRFFRKTDVFENLHVCRQNALSSPPGQLYHFENTGGMKFKQPHLFELAKALWQRLRTSLRAPHDIVVVFGTHRGSVGDVYLLATYSQTPRAATIHRKQPRSHK